MKFYSLMKMRVKQIHAEVKRASGIPSIASGLGGITFLGMVCRSAVRIGSDRNVASLISARAGGGIDASHYRASMIPIWFRNSRMGPRRGGAEAADPFPDGQEWHDRAASEWKDESV